MNTQAPCIPLPPKGKGKVNQLFQCLFTTYTASVLEKLAPSDKDKTKQNPNKVEVLPLAVRLLIIQKHFGAPN